jgi:hypothetical protein
MHDQTSLATEFRATALLRRAANAGVGAFVLHRGDATAGAMLVKVARMDGTAICLGQARHGDGALVWHPVGGGDGWTIHPDGHLSAAHPSSEQAIDNYIARQRAFDSDLWVIEIEDRQGRHFLLDLIVTP